MRVPKPARRGPKPPQPIKRSKAKAGSRTSRRRKARKANKALCDRLWSELIRKPGRCVFEGQILSRGVDAEYIPCGGCECEECLDARLDGDSWAQLPHVCKGQLQAMHGIAKGPYPSARYKLWNGFCGCQGAHVYYTHRPELWVLWLQSRWGDALYAERLRAANHPAKHDYAAIAQGLLEALGRA
jgi:hypothetical protein